MASSPQSTLRKSPLPSPPTAPEAASPSSGGEFLLQLLHQGRPSPVFSSFEPDFISSRSNHSSCGDADALPSRHHSSSSSSAAGWGGVSSFSRASSMDACVFEEEQARIRSLSRASSLEPSVCDDEQAKFHLQQDPAVAAMGPSHRVGEVSSVANSSINFNSDGRGILPFHDHFVQHQHHHQHHFSLQVPPSPPFDVSFPRPPPSEHLLPSPLDPLFRPVPNQFLRPYPYSHFPVVDHNVYLRVPSPSFPHSGLLNSSRLQDMTCTFPYSTLDQVKPFQNSGMASGQNVPRVNTLLPVHRSSADIELRPLAEQPQKSPFYTQFGSIGVEIAPGSKDSSYDVLRSSQDSRFCQQPSLLNERVGVLPSPLAPKAIVTQSLSPIGPLKGDGLSPDLKASIEIAASSHHKRVLEPVCTESCSTEDVKEPQKGPALLMGSVANAHQVAEAALSKEKANSADNYIGATDSIDKVSGGEIAHGIDCESNPRPKGPQKVLESLRKGGSRNALGHWVAVTKDKKEATNVTRMKLVEAPELSRKTSDEVRKRRGQNQGWRMKQSSAGNHSQSQNPDVVAAKPLDAVKMLGQSKAKSPLQQDPLGLPSGTKVDSAPSSATEQSKQALQTSPSTDVVESMMVERSIGSAKISEDSKDFGNEENLETIIDCLDFLELDKDNEIEKEIGGRNELSGSSVSEGLNLNAKQSITKVARPVKPNRREEFHRLDAEKCTNNFLSIFQTLMPPKDEERRRKQLLATLDDLVSGIWPEARLYLFGSCANAFGVCNSDIDVCLSIDGESSTRSEVVCTLADALKAKHMQNVQALTHARVPIVKYSDPTTGISCDVCVNNMLAVVNTKLLHDYAQIDMRLRQLAFMVKHWAKCRQVNETYRGTLSSYAYVLMCIHFLQQRKPPVLPCLQEMEPTYKVTVGDIKCAYFDRVDKLKGFGQKNRENLADLVALFFDYWAFRHDYTRTVISIRTGKFLSKVEKDWTRRIGNERHLICIEDPFEVSHDLGRVVDKHSIRVLRDEFQRAARIMRQDANPCVALFEPYIRQKAQAA